MWGVINFGRLVFWYVWGISQKKCSKNYCVALADDWPSDLLRGKLIEIIVKLEVACYKKKARQNLEYKLFT